MGRPIPGDRVLPGQFCLVKSASCSHANSNQLGESPPVLSRIELLCDPHYLVQHTTRFTVMDRNIRVKAGGHTQTLTTINGQICENMFSSTSVHQYCSLNFPVY